jgi:hypothetical protein
MRFKKRQAIAGRYVARMRQWPNPKLIHKQSVAPPKSILKAAIPLSPLKEIPARKPAKQSQSPTRSPNRKSIPINTNGRAANEGGLPTIGARATSPSKTQHVSPQNVTDVGVDPLDDELAAQDQRKKDKEEALKQREARRKSMGKCLLLGQGRNLTCRSKSKSIFRTRSDFAHVGHAGRHA